MGDGWVRGRGEGEWEGDWRGEKGEGVGWGR